VHDADFLFGGAKNKKNCCLCCCNVRLWTKLSVHVIAILCTRMYVCVYECAPTSGKFLNRFFPNILYVKNEDCGDVEIESLDWGDFYFEKHL